MSAFSVFFHEISMVNLSLLHTDLITHLARQSRALCLTRVNLHPITQICGSEISEYLYGGATVFRNPLTFFSYRYMVEVSNFTVLA